MSARAQQTPNKTPSHALRKPNQYPIAHGVGKELVNEPCAYVEAKGPTERTITDRGDARHLRSVADIVVCLWAVWIHLRLVRAHVIAAEQQRENAKDQHAK